MKFSKTTLCVLLVTAASIYHTQAEPESDVDTSSIKPVKETAAKFDTKNNGDETVEKGGKEKKSKKNKETSEDESFANKSRKRIADGKSEDRADAKKKLTAAKEVSAAERKDIAEGITNAYKAAEIAQRQADQSMSVAQTAQMQADNAYTYCLSQLCDGIQKGAFNIKDGETNDQITKKADEIETLKATVTDMEKTRARMVESGVKAINTTAMSKLIIEELEGRIALALDGEAVVADDKKAALEAELAIARSQAEAIGMNLDLAKKAVTALKKNKLPTEKKAKEVEDLTSKKKDADDKITELEGKIKDLPKVEAKPVDISDLSDQLRKERQKLGKAENAQTILKDKVAKIQQEIDENMAKIAPLEDDLREFVTKSAVEMLGGKDSKTAKKLKGDMEKKHGKKDDKEEGKKDAE